MIVLYSINFMTAGIEVLIILDAYMAKIVFRILMAIYSTLVFWVLYVVKDVDFIVYYLKLAYHCMGELTTLVALLVMPLVVIVIFWKLICRLIRCLSVDDFKGSKQLERAEQNYVPAVMGYCFVALSAGNFCIALTCYVIIVAVVSLSGEMLSFGFIFSGYRFYKIVTSSGGTVILISKNEYLTPLDVKVKRAYRITNLTYVEL